MKKKKPDVLRDLPYVQEGFWPKIKRVANNIPFVNEANALYYCALDENTPKWARRVALGAIAYFIMPFDIIPDALLIAGFTDDASIILAAIKALDHYVTPAHRERAREWLERKS
jgi:uncharacterized membrane protein YkvA (DUF1232 family)